MTPTAIMEAEHRLIETVVNGLSAMAAAIEHGERPDATRLAAAAEFLRVYGDRLHHGKEETFFFPMLVQRGVPPQGCPIGGLNHEHEKGRALVKALAEQATACGAGHPAAREALLETLRGLVDLYQNHIWKEDAMVFPMADKVLTAADQEELSAQFAEVDQAVGLDTIARLETFAASLPPRPAGQASRAHAAQPSNSGCGCTP